MSAKVQFDFRSVSEILGMAREAIESISGPKRLIRVANDHAVLHRCYFSKCAEGHLQASWPKTPTKQPTKSIVLQFQAVVCNSGGQKSQMHMQSGKCPLHVAGSLETQGIE
eukprot:gnl/MRDRNA2_/MRDRNA2_85571_c0_seq3.p1 gnl/MRDRNA2_/MRDRNA2_85571_c0~~gnl/MRDRNA2_/MRDRNA2_85571_c0_seq3.p1  ORF type:complete len:111 (-),score=11.63 gnl/MRDRNA2_/MRDRNA2_85571_c0_seq3:6-338(-)